VKNIICLVTLLFSFTSHAYDLSPQWIYSPADKQVPTFVSGIFERPRFNRSFDQLLEVQNKTLQATSLEAKEKGKWKFVGFNTTLGLGLSGKIGLLSWGGSKVVELFWYRRDASEEKKNISHEQENYYTLDADVGRDAFFSNISRMSAQLEKAAAEKLQAQAEKFFDLAQGMEQANSKVSWEVSKLRWDVELAGSVSPGTVFASVGGDLKIRFEWSRKKKSVSKQLSTSELSKQASDVSEAMVQILDQVDWNKTSKCGLKLSYARLGLGLTLEGKLGIAKLSGNNSFYAYLKPTKKAMKAQNVNNKQFFTLPVIDDVYANSYKSKSNFFKVDGKRVAKNLKKAVRFAAKIGKRLEKKSKTSKWGVKVVRTSFTLNGGGSIGPVSLKASPSLELEFNNEKF